MNKTARIEKIAQDYLHIETLKTRNSDRLDFHDIGVGCLSDALNVAFDAGYNTAIMEQRTQKATADGINAFWSTITSHFREIKTGDFPPDLAFEMETQLTNMVKIWVEINGECHP